VECCSEERAYISYLEMKTISRFFMFGKTYKSLIYPRQSTTKKFRSIPIALERAIEQSAKQ
jgi:hypothetical protein